MTKSSLRIKTTGEIFTPPALVDHILNKLANQDSKLFTDPTKLFLDPACGEGALLCGVIRKFKQARGPSFLKNRWQWYHSISTQVLGVDLMWDNVCDTVYHLLRSRYKNDTVQLKEIESDDLQTSPIMSPEEINEQFSRRIYVDTKGAIEIQKVENTDHYVQYRFQKGSWTRVENIVRANSLTEWNFETWEPKHKYLT